MGDNWEEKRQQESENNCLVPLVSDQAKGGFQSQAFLKPSSGSMRIKDPVRANTGAERNNDMAELN